MSWLFGRRGEDDDDDDDDDEEYSDGEGYTTSDDEEEEGENNGKDKHVEEPKPAKMEEETSKKGVLQNGHAPAPTADENELKAEEKTTNEEPSQEPTEAIKNGKEEKVAAENDSKAEETTAAEKEEANNQSHPVADEATTTGKEEKEPESQSFVEELQEKNEKKTEENSASEPVENGDTVKPQPETPGLDTEKKQEVDAPAEDDAKQKEGPAEEDKNEKGEAEEEITSTHEKRSLLVLAAEHDRVDILKAILADDSEDRHTLLNSSIPPLHISITYGSTNAVQCLLRMGADPSVRPDIQRIKEEADAEGEEQLVDIPHMGRFDKLSAWELAFGKADQEDEPAKKKSGGWFGGGKKSGSIDIAPSKLEGIRHAFTAEGLRCIGSDEVDRLRQLIESGMPSTIDIGGKNLYDWAVEMGALQCEELLRPAEADRNSNEDATNTEGQPDKEQKSSENEGGSSAVRDRSKPGTESISQLNNRIDELESLSNALSSCLDNLAEEVSVCHGLLLMGGGASALAAHVRSLKTLKENKIAELDRLQEAWENSEDELAYWVKECGEAGKEIAQLMSPAIISSAENDHPPFEGTPEEEQAHRQQLRAEAALLENKIRKLRASITDLSEESTRDLEEVENRGLSGGIKLVRSLRDEIREVEFALNETKSAEALCRAKIKLIQSKMGQGKKQSINAKPSSGSGEIAPAAVTPRKARQGDAASEPAKAPSGAPTQLAQEPRGVEEVTRSAIEIETVTSSTPVFAEAKTPSEAVTSGQSSAIALKSQGNPGYFTVDLWKILLRIIGLGSSSRPMAPSQNSASNVMIV